ncbi:putative glycoside hydrolase [Butyrivibrio sp. MC2013]|uniref:putative glycoside hydrolase n=1 Tax=Butyrivibrio sp. MC2013 TaxID=1280686 RepID=UPI0004021AA1|nr:putative glycoside hydrolase [Butyrivibrio sp. MC2013]
MFINRIKKYSIDIKNSEGNYIISKIKKASQLTAIALILALSAGQGGAAFAAGNGNSATKAGQERHDASASAENENDDNKPIHGIYVSAYVAGSTSMMDEIIEHIDKCDINAVVIDVKNDEGNIVFDMDSPLVDEAGSENILVRDMPGLMDKLHEHGIYAIARCVAFRDPYIDEVKPDWMLKDGNGAVYTDAKGFSWIDPRNKEAGDYLIEVAAGCGKAGFDEVQFDYVRYPTGLKEEDSGINGYVKRHGISSFVRRAHQSLIRENIPLSLDLFGTVIASDIDRDIVGQEYGSLSMNCEYLSPMIYPSHYYDGSMGLDHPDLYPYETIDGAMKKSAEELKRVNPKGTGKQAAVRPWLQGFTASYLKKYRKYGAEEIKAQIQAVADNGIDSWIIWNPSCKYQWEAFEKTPQAGSSN